MAKINTKDKKPGKAKFHSVAYNKNNPQDNTMICLDCKVTIIPDDMEECKGKKAK